VLDLAEALPTTRTGNIVANQLGRAGTSVAANYRAACKARSQAEFIAKVGTVEEEADESSFWLEITSERQLVPPRRVTPLLKESYEIVAIMGASRLTAGRNRPLPKSRTNRQSAIGNRQ